MRQLDSHKINEFNEALRIEVMDEPGHGNANHFYGITSEEPRSADVAPAVTLPIRFQNGTVNEAGVNGVTNESLLAIVEDRLKGFQSGPFACRENAVALTKVQEALMWLHKRSKDRVQRGVEGTHNT